MRKWILGFASACLVVVGALALLAANLDSYLQENREWVAEQAQLVLGRPLSFGEAGISLMGGVGVRVADLRIGDDPGQHTAFFAGIGERLEIKHVSTSRDSYALGALRAAKWLASQKPGRYDMSDVLGL